MKLIIENGKTFALATELHLWEKNPRSIQDVDFERLKRQIKKFGQYKPLLVTEDGTVLGGNMRLRAFRELNVDKLWVSVVKPKDENEMMEISLSDNDRAGYYDVEQMANIMPNYDIDWTQYSVDLTVPEDLGELLTKYPEAGGGDDNTANGVNIAYTIIFDNEEQQAKWFDFIKWLKVTYEKDSIAECLAEHISQQI